MIVFAGRDYHRMIQAGFVCFLCIPLRALGTHDNKEINVEGRVQFDVLELVRRDHKLKSYSLNYVSYEFLKEQKVRRMGT